jgi:phage protein D
MSDETFSPVDIYKDQDFYVPSYKILVGTQELRAVSDVMNVTYTDSLTSIDSFDITVSNWDAESLSFKYSDGATFLPWSEAELWMGYLKNGQDQRRRMLIGEITTMAPNFPSGGGPTLNVRALNLLHRFRTKQEVKTYFNKTDTEIAQDLVALIAEVIRKRTPQVTLELDPDDVKANQDHEQPLPFLILNNQYPIVFLMERARRIGYDLSTYVVPVGTSKTVFFHFRPSSEIQRRTYVLQWGASLISFQPTLRTADQVSKVTVRGWHPGDKKPIEKSATRADLVSENVVNPLDLGVTEPPLNEEITVDRPVADEVEAEEFAKKILRQKASELVTGRGKTIGLPELRAGVKIRIDNLGRFSGTYLVTDTTHSMGDGGYTTDFTARMEKGLPS